MGETELRKYGSDCPSCGNQHEASLVYAIGRLTPQFPSLGVEKEFQQLISSPAMSERALDNSALQTAMSEAENIYLARHMCWILRVQQVDSLAVVPRNDDDLSAVVRSLPVNSQTENFQVIVGRIVTTPPGRPCSGSGLLTVEPDQILSFELSDFLDAVLREAVDDPSKRDREAAREAFLRMAHKADNQGLSDGHRALNYLALRYSDVYRLVIEKLKAGQHLVSTEARHAHGSTRLIVAVSFHFRDEHSGLFDTHRCTVDVTEVFPFLVSGLTRVYE
ncbi:hypothetical protein RKD27_004435 [Streptomyces sp. SAI-126]|uniref:cyanobactin maturation protease PatG family protein n=1 Tax=Streptomyces sp. SAI-126 TaxID=3377732 RepID=UPI003C7ACF64